MNRTLAFDSNGWEDYVYWQTQDRRTLKRINQLIADVLREPFTGIGKPEQLKHILTGAWSRRIDEANRLVYYVTKDTIVILQATRACASGRSLPDSTAVTHWVQMGQAIRDARTEAGLTQLALATKAGVSRAWLARVESGHRKAEVEYLMRTLDALGLALAVTSTPQTSLTAALAEALREAGIE